MLDELMAKRGPQAQECLCSVGAQAASPSCVFPWGSAGCAKEARRWSKSKFELFLSLPPGLGGLPGTTA